MYTCHLWNHSQPQARLLMHHHMQIRPAMINRCAASTHLNAVVVVHASGQHAPIGRVQHGVAAVRTSDAARLNCVITMVVPGRAQRARPRRCWHLQGSDGWFLESTQTMTIRVPNNVPSLPLTSRYETRWTCSAELRSHSDHTWPSGDAAKGQANAGPGPRGSDSPRRQGDCDPEHATLHLETYLAGNQPGAIKQRLQVDAGGAEYRGQPRGVQCTAVAVAAARVPMTGPATTTSTIPAASVSPISIRTEESPAECLRDAPLHLLRANVWANMRPSTHIYIYIRIGEGSCRRVTI